MSYKHTQIWYFIISILITSILFFLALLIYTWLEPWILALIAVFILIIAWFSTLKITVNNKKIKIKFGYWIFKKSFALSEIKAVKEVKNRWFYGWGIRVWFWPYMWIYNISWFDAVELKMKNWKIFRLWTDDSKQLKKAIDKKLKK